MVQVPAVVTSLTITVTVSVQLSVVVTAAIEAAGTSAAHVTVTGVGVPVITGGVVSLIVIVLDTEASVLPQMSVAVQVSVTFPLQFPATVVENVDELEFPSSKQPPLNPLVNGIVLEAGNAPQVTVISPGATIVGNTAGLTVIVLDTGAKSLPQMSVAVHVSVTVPPQAPGVVVNVDGLEVPLIKHPALNPLLKDKALGVNNEPQATVVFAGAVIVGKAAGLIVIVLVFVIVRPWLSVYVHVSVTVPPQAPAGV